MKITFILIISLLLSCNSFKQQPDQLHGTWKIDEDSLKEYLEIRANNSYPNDVIQQEKYISRLYNYSINEEWTFNKNNSYQKNYQGELLGKGNYQIIDRGIKFLKIRTYPEYTKHFTQSELEHINQLSEEQLIEKALKEKMNHSTFIIGVHFSDNQTCELFHFKIKNNKNSKERIYGVSSVYKKKI